MLSLLFGHQLERRGGVEGYRGLSLLFSSQLGLRTGQSIGQRVQTSVRPASLQMTRRLPNLQRGTR